MSPKEAPVAVRNLNCNSCPERLLTVEYFHFKKIDTVLEFTCDKCGESNRAALKTSLKLAGGPLAPIKSGERALPPATQEIACFHCSELLLRLRYSSIAAMGGNIDLECMACGARAGYKVTGRTK